MQQGECVTSATSQGCGLASSHGEHTRWLSHVAHERQCDLDLAKNMDISDEKDIFTKKHTLP